MAVSGWLVAAAGLCCAVLVTHVTALCPCPFTLSGARQRGQSHKRSALSIVQSSSLATRTSRRCGEPLLRLSREPLSSADWLCGSGWRRTYVLAFRHEDTIALERKAGFTHSHNDSVNVSPPPHQQPASALQLHHTPLTQCALCLPSAARAHTGPRSLGPPLRSASTVGRLPHVSSAVNAVHHSAAQRSSSSTPVALRAARHWPSLTSYTVACLPLSLCARQLAAGRQRGVEMSASAAVVPGSGDVLRVCGWSVARQRVMRAYQCRQRQ